MASSSKKPKFQFYRRQLPKTCIDFVSQKGQDIFKEAMSAGGMGPFFKLSAQFRTQDEPAYCALTSLVMALNSLEIDPGRVWKGPWRWYHEDMLDCCISLDIVKEKGMDWEQFACLARCNNLSVEQLRAVDFKSLDQLRTLIKQKMQIDNQVVIASYSRAVLKQSGSGHFSPIAGYHEGKDLVLILDVARFKYPPHWITLSDLFEAMQAIDPDTGLSRGLVLLSRSKIYVGTLLYRPSCSFVVNSERGAMPAQILNFSEKWTSFLDDQEGSQDDASLQTSHVIQQFVKSALSSLDGISLLCLVMQSNSSGQCDSLCCTMKCTNFSVEEMKEINCVYFNLIKELEGLRTYELFKEVVSSLSKKDRVRIMALVSHKELSAEDFAKHDSCAYQSCHNKEKIEFKCHEECQDSELSLKITPENILTVIFLAWPLKVGDLAGGKKRDCITALVEQDLLEPSKRTIKQEILSLQFKLVEALNYHSSDPQKPFFPHGIFL